MSLPTMGTNQPSIGITVWRKPRVYGTTVAMHFVAMVIASVAYLVFSPHYYNPTVSDGVNLAFGLLLLSPILAFSIISAIKLIREKELKPAGNYAIYMLIILLLLSVYFLLTLLLQSDDSRYYFPRDYPVDFATWNAIAYAIAFSLIAANGLMFTLLYKRYSISWF
jgi:hypothetical protein